MKKKNIPDVEMTVSENLTDIYEVLINQTIENFIKSKNFLQHFNYYPVISSFKVIRNKNAKLGDYSTNFLISTYHNSRSNSEIHKYTNSKEFFKNVGDSFFNYIDTEDPNFYNTWKMNISENSGHLNFFIKDEKKVEMLAHHEILNKNFKPINKVKKNQTNFEKTDEYNLEFLDELIKEPKISIDEIKHKYSIELESNSKFNDEKFNVYKKYQMTIHNDKEKDLTPDRYVSSWGSSNLVNRPLNMKNSSNPLFPLHFGTWDLIHKIDGKIFAVGILDILPTSVSSVYLYYDPDFSFLNPGVLTAVREIELVNEFKKHLDRNFRYYVMGFYCHTCPKMKYKGDYYPTEILCPITFNFVDLEKVVADIATNKYQKISKESVQPEMVILKDEINAIMKSFILTYRNRNYNLVSFVNDYIAEHSSDILKNLENFVIFVGKENIRHFKFCVS